MTEDARFEDGREAPLNLGAVDPEDVRVLAALCQDAVFPITEMLWLPRQRQFALLLNRFRWEDRGRDRHAPERVQSVLSFDGVLGVSSQGINRRDKNTILSVLAIEWAPDADGAGEILLHLAGDGAIRLRVEAIDARLKDVTRPYIAPSKQAPHHPE